MLRGEVEHHQISEEIRCDPLEIVCPLEDGHVSVQEFLVNTTERTQEITQSGPYALHSVAMDFTDAIAIIISSPFVP